MFRTYLYVGSVILGTLILQLGNGMLGPTVVLRAAGSGEAAGYVALIPAGYGLGFLLGCFWARSLIESIGHIRTFAVAAALLASISICMQLFPSTPGWIALRAFSGCCIAVISTCADSWVGHSTPYEHRGRVLALYALTIKVAHVAAPALLAAAALVDERALLYAALLFALSLLPVSMTRLPAPEIARDEPLSTRVLLLAAPSAFVACFAVGLGNGAVLNLLPVHSLAMGLSVAAALTLLTVSHLGGLVLQWPLGFLSDATDRRVALVLGLVGAGASALALQLVVEAAPALAWIPAFLWGGFALSVYSICLAHAVDHVERDQMVSACATLLVTWSAGAVAGPVAAGALMSGFGPSALLAFGTVCYLAAALFVAWRLLRTAHRRRREHFINVPVTSPSVHLLDPRQPSAPDEPRREHEGPAPLRSS